jgi:hypothetical protein
MIAFMKNDRVPRTMTDRDAITASFARQLLDYDKISGLLLWKARVPEMFEDSYHSAETQCKQWNSRLAGKVAGHIGETDGYVRVYIDDVPYLAHRVIWLIVKGRWPEKFVDHKNGIRSDLKWKNLREATGSQNGQNRKINRNNPNGMTGVTWRARENRWVARISIEKSRIFLGGFSTKEAAHAAYLAAKTQLHRFQPVPREKPE